MMPVIMYQAFHAQIRGERLISNLHLGEQLIFSLNLIHFVLSLAASFCREPDTIFIIDIDTTLEFLLIFFEIMQFILKRISVLRNTWNEEYNIILWKFVQTIVIPLIICNAIHKYMSAVLERHIHDLPIIGEHLLYFFPQLVQTAFKFFLHTVLLPKIKKYFDFLGKSLPTINNGAIIV